MVNVSGPVSTAAAIISGSVKAPRASEAGATQSMSPSIHAIGSVFEPLKNGLASSDISLAGGRFLTFADEAQPARRTSKTRQTSSGSAQRPIL